LIVHFLLLVVLSIGTAVSAQEMTDVGTPRNETLIFQTFDRQSSNPDQHNPLMSWDVWRGFRELGMGFLWETDTGTGDLPGRGQAGLATGYHLQRAGLHLLILDATRFVFNILLQILTQLFLHTWSV
jgi:hypothetical protein